MSFLTFTNVTLGNTPKKTYLKLINPVTKKSPNSMTRKSLTLFKSGQNFLFHLEREHGLIKSVSEKKNLALLPLNL